MSGYQVEPVTRVGALQFLKTQYQLLQEDAANAASRLRTLAPETAKQFDIMSEAWEVAAHIVIELQQGGLNDNDGTDYANADRLVSSLALVQRLLNVIIITSSVSEAMSGNAPEWLQQLMSKDNGPTE